MLVLSLDSTSPAGSVAIWRDGALVVVRPTDPERGFSEQLPGVMLDVLDDHGLRLADVSVFAVASGPGSLTGLRVGIATIQGLAFAGDRPVVAVSALQATARAAWDTDHPPASGSSVAAWRDARRGEVFSCLYRAGGGAQLDEIEPPCVGLPERTLTRWRDLAGVGRDILLIGDAAPAALDLARAILGPTARAAPGSLLAGTVAELAAERAARGETTRPHAVQPLYVRKPDAELARERSLKRAGTGARQTPAAAPRSGGT
jgi:tRNA threonylcarbamoyladenosine biosynthesis protein TsaB